MRLLVVTVSLVVLGAAGCTSAATPTTITEVAPLEIDVQKAAWDALAIEDYRIVFEVRNLNGMGGSGGDGRFDVTVRDGNVMECTIEDDPFGKTGACNPPIADPVDRLFALLARFEISLTEVTYHPEWHLPERIDFDDPTTVDDEYRIRLLDFETLGSS